MFGRYISSYGRGNMITLTDKAITHIKEIMANEGLEGQFVRVKVVGFGCVGMGHDMYFEIKADENDEVVEINGVKILIDQLSFQYLENINVDYLDGPISSGFKFSSPDIKGSCGCGNSVSY
jgi:iron-sulfur cluster assembly accessory protein